ncbi:uncharacterized protein LOC115767246 isoform X2 [Drosophila novamexicana]|uniref:uncharacterized protein LOC115767246 isoform X2 n=1 Tax=Drosophila novamexicana TaxID=47314 RepID=UPI0011E5E034|nr:uncharacterized protein LOC115767246 isoform X2 [Drosophila novamexicana]
MSLLSEIKAGTAITAGTRAGTLHPDLKPWQRIDLPLCTQSNLFKDWGCRLRNKKALEYFTRALSVCKSQGNNTCCFDQPTTPAGQRCKAIEGQFCSLASDALDKRSLCRRSIAQPELAWEDAQKAHELLELQGLSNIGYLMNKCDALFECNRFEDNLVQLNIEARKYQGQSIKDRFQLRANHTIGVLEDTLGDSLHPFLLDNWPLITEVARARRTSVAFMPRPLWQQLSEKFDCDVESVNDIQKPLLSPLERARRQVCKRVYNNQYLHKSAVDVVMLGQLQNDKNFLNPLSHYSTPYMSELASEQYAIVKKFMKLMHARNPLYHCRQVKCRVSKICEKNRENYLYRVEHQTRRDCFRMLREVHRRRQEQNIERLTDYVEHIMSSSIELKTQRTLPWKWEFVTEVYNILALAHIDRCAVPKNIDFLDLKNHSMLYLLPTDRVKEQTITFGGPNVYSEIDKDDERLSRVTKKLNRLKDRLIHSRYAIERTYLFFEIARCHFKESRFDKTLIMAHKASHEARICNSIVWRFNITFLICQVHAIFNRFERLSESLGKAKQLAARLKSTKLQAYLALCNAVNDYELDYQRKKQSEHNLPKSRRRKGRPSLASFDSADNNL